MAFDQLGFVKLSATGRETKTKGPRGPATGVIDQPLSPEAELIKRISMGHIEADEALLNWLTESIYHHAQTNSWELKRQDSSIQRFERFKRWARGIIDVMVYGEKISANKMSKIVGVCSDSYYRLWRDKQELIETWVKAKLVEVYPNYTKH